MEDNHCWLVLVIVFAFLHATDGLTCLSCNDAPSPEDCEYTVVCQAHEICYLEQYVTSIGSFRYHLGCRDSKQCHPGTVGRRSLNETARRSTDLLICTSCCSNSDLCNSAGCGKTGYPYVPSRGPICYNCAQQLAPGKCNKIKICGRGDVCQITKSSTYLYSSDCINQQTCENSYNFFRSILFGKKRLSDELFDTGKHCLHKCCDGDLCNGNCGTVGTVALPPIPTSGQIDPCLSNPCVHGSCSIYSNTYKCTCKANAHGRNCEHYDDPCLSNPCVHGACHTNGAGFTCQCNPGYSGTLCDIQPDPCSSNKCVHGSCHANGASYSCQCQTGYMGTYCDTHIDPCSSNKCVHGSCHANGASYSCQCQTGYMGTYCDTHIDPCSSHSCAYGVCHASGASYTCQCYSGFIGTLCDQVHTIDPCIPYPCAHGYCRPNGASYTCQCNGGYTGTNCDQAVIVDPCTANPYTCQCNPAYCGGGSTGGGSSCGPDGSSDHLTYNGHCYHVYKHPEKTWSDAQSYCQSHGGGLAHIDSNSELQWLLSKTIDAHQKEWWISEHCKKIHKVSRSIVSASCSDQNSFVCENT